MNKKYNLKLDLQFRCNNSIMKFNQFDNNTSDFFMRITNGGNLVDIEKAIVVLAVIKPSGKVSSQFVEVENGLVYADLKPSMKDEIGTCIAKAMLVLEDKRVVTDSVSYEVEEDKVFSLLNDSAEASEEFTLLTDMLSRLSTIETNEEQRVINEAERILSEENRKTEEAERVEAELVRQHEEAGRTKYDAIRESNENIRKQNESTRLANETNRIDEEAKRVEEENKRKLAEEERNANYNFMTEDEERRRSEANAHKEAEVLRVQAETNRVNEEAKRRTTEQGRVSAENTRVSNENTREASELTRQNNETQRVEAETQRQNRYNSFISDAEANANSFENYTNTAKVKEEERKSNELTRKSQETKRVSNEVERISNENTRKANEITREKNETSRQYVFENKVNEVDEKIIEINTTKDNFVSSINTKVDNKISELDNAKSDMTNTVSNKVNEIETRFNTLTSKQQQSSEVIDARDGETSLKARLDRDIEKAKQVYVNVEGSNISTGSSSGYAKNVEILGNTIQSASNLADIRSVGDKVEGQELYEIPVVSCGKNLFNISQNLELGSLNSTDGMTSLSDRSNNLNKNTNGFSVNVISPYGGVVSDFIRIKPNTTYTFSGTKNGDFAEQTNLCYFDNNKNSIASGWTDKGWRKSFTTPSNACYLKIGWWLYAPNTISYSDIQLEEGTQATPYEPYQEHKLTILSPVQLEKVGDVRDRIIEKDGVWGVEKNIVTHHLKDYAHSDYDGFACRTTLPNACISNDIYTDIPFYTNLDYLHTNINLQWNNRNINSIAINNAVINSVNSCPCDITSENYVYQDIIKMIEENNIWVKYALLEPQFIPLPHDQQIKLRTFANKTNISFLTEIEGTIKAQVPKSLGATVNTHTEQINNLNNELNRVKKLEESTVSTVTTESDFTTVEATSNGYFEDVKLEGKTLVNLWDDAHSFTIIADNSDHNLKVRCIKPDTQYTLMLLCDKNASGSINLKDANNGYVNLTAIGAVQNLNTPITFTTLSDGDFTNVIFRLFSSRADVVVSGAILLEGDHTQNPPSFFEGLKSVGQSATTSEDGADEIVVSSVNENLWNDVLSSEGSDRVVNGNPIKFHSGYTYTLSFRGLSTLLGSSNIQIFLMEHRGYPYPIDGNSEGVVQVISNWSNKDSYTFTVPRSGKFYIQTRGSQEIMKSFTDISLSVGVTGTHTPHQSDKKRLLYYNEETQTWEKPILREWDSIEKHADGKYYYHQRSGEVVLDGEQGNNWQLEKTNTNTLVLRHPNLKCIKNNENINVICDKFKPVKHSVGWVLDSECIHISVAGELHINISRSNANSLEDALNFLNSANITVVYQLAQEKVYECTNIDLITYANETNYVVNSGVLSPKTTLKVHNNISNVVSLLQKKVSLLESNVKASQEVQDMMILETDMRMLDIELALMEFIPMTLNLGGSDMLRSATYFNFLKNHIINETYEKEYLENVMNKYLATGRINQDEYNELYKMLYPPVYDIELPIEY